MLACGVFPSDRTCSGSAIAILGIACGMASAASGGRVSSGISSSAGVSNISSRRSTSKTFGETEFVLSSKGGTSMAGAYTSESGGAAVGASSAPDSSPATTSTVPANGGRRSSHASQIGAGDRRRKVKLCDQPLSPATDGRFPDGFTVRRGQSHPMILQQIEQGRIACRNALDPLGQQMCPQPVRNGLAHQPQGILCQPAIGGLWLIQLQFFLEQIAQTIEQFALQAVSGCDQRAGGIAAEGLSDRGAIGLDH